MKKDGEMFHHPFLLSIFNFQLSILSLPPFSMFEEVYQSDAYD